VLTHYLEVLSRLDFLTYSHGLQRTLLCLTMMPKNIDEYLIHALLVESPPQWEGHLKIVSRKLSHNWRLGHLTTKQFTSGRTETQRFVPVQQAPSVTTNHICEGVCVCVVPSGCACRLGANVLQLVQPRSICLINPHQLPYPGLEDHDIQILEEKEDK
jgi:hypothetical protein